MRSPTISVFWRQIVVIGLILLTANFSACTSAKDIQAQIVDEQRNPVPNALLYYEIRTNRTVYDFGFAVAGNDGNVPASGTSPVKVTWRSGAKLSIAAFARGYVPTVLSEPPGKVDPQGNVIILRNPAKSILPFEPRLMDLAFPFEKYPQLRSRLSQPQYLLLRKAFVSAYESMDFGERTLPEYQRAKINAVWSLKRYSGHP
jgi:hypothetical protein